MPSYFVTWEIDVFNVANPREAAKQALEIMQDEDSLAKVFKVIDHDCVGDPETVDLDEDEDDEDNDEDGEPHG